MNEIENLIQIIRRLRAPDGCPWDREQTHESLKESLVGETAEYLDAVDQHSDSGMCEELGDLLLQVIMNSVMAEERGAFTLNDVAKGVADKMVRRHPHVFGNVHVNNSSEVLVNWESIKKKEHADYRKSAMDGVPRNLPAVLRAEKLQKRAEKHGFDWKEESAILKKIHEELDELDEAWEGENTERINEEAADLVFSVINFLRFRKENCEKIIHLASDKFESRFRKMEMLLDNDEKTIDGTSLERLDELWNLVKKEI